jgi:glucose-6-phosphate isomerase
MDFAIPFANQINLPVGIISTARVSQRRLTEMRLMYHDHAAAGRIIEQEGNRLIYEVYAAELPEAEGQVLYCTTILYPGQVGDEYHMTKGHYHVKRDRAEVYLGLAGEGYLLLQLEDGRVQSLPMSVGTVAYVPPFWAHRSVNTGSSPFVFFAVWPGDAGHDYATIEQFGFSKLLIAQEGKPALVDNPQFTHQPGHSNQ